MKSIHIAILATFLNCTSCTPGGKSENDSADNRLTTLVLPDTLTHNVVVTDSLISLAKQHNDSLSQDEYTSIIEQCTAINRKVSQKLAAMNFKPDMSDQELQNAMNVLNNDPELPVLEAQSHDLLRILQRADLNETNRKLYDQMVSEARKTLENL